MLRPTAGGERHEAAAGVSAAKASIGSSAIATRAGGARLLSREARLRRRARGPKGYIRTIRLAADQPAGKLRTAAETELVEDATELISNRELRRPEEQTDVPAGQPARRVPGNLRFARGETLEAGRLGLPERGIVCR